MELAGDIVVVVSEEDGLEQQRTGERGPGDPCQVVDLVQEDVLQHVLGDVGRVQRLVTRYSQELTSNTALELEAVNIF